MNIGRKNRLNRLFEKNRTVLVPLDGFLIEGTQSNTINVNEKFKSIIKGEPNGILGYTGTFNSLSKLTDVPINGILNLTASTDIGNPIEKKLISSVEYAIKLGMVAVAVHVNVTSRFENDMIHNFGIIASACEKFGIPIMAKMYPRKLKNGEQYNYFDIKESNKKEYVKLLRHSVRIAEDLGADIIKTYYPGDKESLNSILLSCPNSKYIMAGGSVKSIETLFHEVKDVIDVGGSGVCIGRNIYEHPNSELMINSLKKIVHYDYEVEEIINEIRMKTAQNFG